MAFDDIRLPEEVEQGAHFGPSFQTTIVSLSSGNEQRNQDWSIARRTGDISYGVDNPANFGIVRDFLLGRRGKSRGWRFKDWSDYQLVTEPIGNQAGTAQVLGDGVTTTFQVIKTYEPTGPNPYIRRITRPVAGTTQAYVNGALTTLASTIVINVNGVLETNWTLSGTNFIVFAGGHIPPLNATITVTCDFDVPVRFDIDNMSAIMNTPFAMAIDHLPIIELRE